MASFTAEKLAESPAPIYRIRGSGGDSYLLPGRDSAIMIDSGMSAENIRTFAEESCSLPVPSVVNTHSHFDHTGGNGFFDTIYGTAGISRSAKNTFGGDPALYPLDYDFTIVKDKDIIEIEGRQIEVILLDSHSPENIALLDIQGRALFPGDEIDSGQVLLLPGYAEKPGQFHAKPAASIETFLGAMYKLQAQRSRFDKIYPAHNGAPLEPDYIDRYITLASRLLEGDEGSSDCSGRGYHAGMGHFPLPEANYRRYELNGVSLIYCADLIWDADYARPQYEPATELHRASAQSIHL